MPTDTRFVLDANTWKSIQTNKLYPINTVIPPGPPDTIGSLPIGSATYAPPAGAVYMSLSGSDSNDGSVGSPKASLTAAMAAAGPGGTVVCRAGSYFEGGDTQSGSLNPGVRFDKQVTIQNYPGEAVWFDGSIAFAPTDWTFDSATGLYWAPYNRVFDRSHTFSSGAADVDSGSGQTGGKFVDDALNPVAANPDQLFLNGTQLKQVATKGAVVAGTFWVEGATTTGLWFQASKVWIKDNPSGQEVRYAAKTRLGQTWVAGVTIRGIGIRRYASYQAGFGLMYVANPNTLLENVRVEDVSASAFWADSSAGLTFRKVTSRRVGFCTLGGRYTDELMFDSVDFRQSNYRNFAVGGPAVAVVKISGAQHITVQTSIMSDSNCNGFWTDRTVDRPEIISSWFQNLGRHGLDIEGSSDYLVLDTVITNVGGQAIWNNDSDQGEVWNCTLEDSHRVFVGGSPFQIGQSARRATDPNYAWMKDTRQPSSYYDPAIHPDHNYQCNSFLFKNNVVVQSNGAKAQGIFSCQSASDTATPSRKFADFGPQMDSNVYWYETQPQYPFIATNGAGVNPTIYFNLGAFKTGTGQEVNSFQATSKPVNSAHQLTDSTLHNRATPLPAAIAARIGQPTGVKRIGSFLVGDPA